MTKGESTGGSIYIVGFMGVGKSTVGRHLAERLHMPFYDMDEEIERTQHRKIHEIFEAEGEEWFRALETELLSSIARRPPGVVATGGGTFCRPENRRLIHSGGVSVWLDAPTDLILERGAQETHRPLWTSVESMKALLAERIPMYQQANVHFRVESLAPEETAAKLASLLRDYREQP